MPAAVVLLRFPHQRVDNIARRWVQFHLAWLVVSRLTFTVPAPNRRLGWWPAIPMSTDVASTASTIGNGVLSASTLFFGGLLVRRIMTSKGAARHELVPVLVAAISAVVTVVSHLSSVANGRSGVPNLILGIEQFALMSVPAAFIFSALVMRMAHGAVASLLLQVDVTTGRPELQRALAQTLSDPDLEIFFPGRDAGWFDADGTQVTVTANPTGRVDVPITDPDRSLLALLRIDPVTLRHRAFLDATTAASALLIRNMNAVEQLRGLPARIAEGGYLERLRIERDLHDGVQQRLIALGMSIDRVQRGGLDDDTRQLAANAAADLQEAVRELRDFARGTYPAVLAQHGLHAAIHSATDRMSLDVSLSIPPERRWPSAIEATAYFLICEALTNVAKHAGVNQVAVVVADDGHAISVSVRDAGRGGAAAAERSGLAGLIDRVHAIGGTTNIISTEGQGTCVTATLPYA